MTNESKHPMTLTEEQKFRQWLNKTYGVQDYEAYRETMTEEIAIRYATSKCESLYTEEQVIDMLTAHEIATLSVLEAKTLYPKLFASRKREVEKWFAELNDSEQRFKDEETK